MTDEWKRRYGIFIHTRALLSNNKSEMLIFVTNWTAWKGVVMTKVRREEKGPKKIVISPTYRI